MTQAMNSFEEKSARNSRVQNRYNELMAIGKHGHYETMFRVVREECERVAAAAALAVQPAVCAMTLNEFHNGLRILRSIDLYEIEAAGFHMEWDDWVQFRNEPYRFFLAANDETASVIWAIVENRGREANHRATAALARVHGK